MKGSSHFFMIRLVAAWYSSNIGVLLLSKYLLSNFGFKYPIFLTMCHMTACSLLSYVAIAWLKVVPLQTIRSRVQFFKTSALSLAFCVFVVFSNREERDDTSASLLSSALKKKEMIEMMNKATTPADLLRSRKSRVTSNDGGWAWDETK